MMRCVEYLVEMAEVLRIQLSPELLSFEFDGGTPSPGLDSIPPFQQISDDVVWQGTSKAECDKERFSRRLKVRKSTTIEDLARGGQTRTQGGKEVDGALVFCWFDFEIGSIPLDTNEESAIFIDRQYV
jgi:hypothetical protein